MIKSRDKRELGRYGEQIALAALERQGMTLLIKNFRAERCEIDLIMQDGDTVVFVEVKARHGGMFGRGREAVDRRKQEHLIRAATSYALSHGLMDSPLRFDVVEVDLDRESAEHIKNAFIS